MTDPLTFSADRIDLLQTFVRIVEAGSLSAAAERLGTSQPTISRRLQTLERALGLKLLQRSTHAMKLTDDGERCFAHAKDLLQSWSSMEADLRGAKDEPRGVLRVSVPHAFGQDQLIAPLTTYLGHYPEVSVEWILHDRRPDFVAEGIDCAVQVGIVNDPALVALLVADVPRIVVAQPGLWGDGPRPHLAADLNALPWIALNPYYRDEVSLTRQGDSEICQFAIRPRLITDSLYALRAAALAGLGAAIASSWIVAQDIEDERLVHLAPDWHASPLPVYIVFPYARFYPAKIRRFVDLMRATLPTIAGMRARR